MMRQDCLWIRWRPFCNCSYKIITKISIVSWVEPLKILNYWVFSCLSISFLNGDDICIVFYFVLLLLMFWKIYLLFLYAGIFLKSKANFWKGASRKQGMIAKTFSHPRYVLNSLFYAVFLWWKASQLISYAKPIEA